MATIDWPSDAAFVPRALRIGVNVAKSSWAGFFSGQVQQVSHAADRLRCTVTLPPCDGAAGARREAWLLGLASTGDWVRMPHLHRIVPAGTLRGLPTVAASALAGARSVQITTTPGATLVGGDVLGINGQLVMVGYAGAAADGAGLITVPLALPLPVPVSTSLPVLWQLPPGLWQLLGASPDVDYGRGAWQGTVEIAMQQVVPLA